MKKENKRIFSPFALFSFAVFLAVLVIYILCSVSVGAADFFNSTLCHEFRRLFAAFGDLFPFSLVEVIILTSPITVGIVVFFAVRAASKERGLRFIINILSAALLFYSGHLIALGIAYKTTPVSEKMGIPEVEVTEDALAEVMISLRNEVNELAPMVSRNEEGVFESNTDFDGISRKICESYAGFSEKYGFPKSFSSRAKSVYHGNLMSYLEITGVYTYITGEANVNSAFPDYDRIFTAAHELSHQRGVLRENEANFMAYVVCSTSNDTELRYSAALSMYEYISSALYKTNRERYREIAAGLCDGALRDIRASYEVIEKYSDTFIGRLSNKVNDIFLKSNGTDGVITYSRVVELVIAYYAR